MSMWDIASKIARNTDVIISLEAMQQKYFLYDTKYWLIFSLVVRYAIASLDYWTPNTNEQLNIGAWRNKIYANAYPPNADGNPISISINIGRNKQILSVQQNIEARRAFYVKVRAFLKIE